MHTPLPLPAISVRYRAASVLSTNDERTNERERRLSPSLEAGKIASLKRRVGSRPSCSPLFRVAAFGSGRQRRLSDSVYFRVKFSPDRFAISRRIVLRTIHLLRAVRACRNSPNAPFTFDRSPSPLPIVGSHPFSPRRTSRIFGRAFQEIRFNRRRRVHVCAPLNYSGVASDFIEFRVIIATCLSRSLSPARRDRCLVIEDRYVCSEGLASDGTATWSDDVR